MLNKLVFDKDYDLKSLDEIERYISVNNHLPEVPSATEFKENGVQVGEMQMKLLQKVEELTLHLIEQSKSLETYKKTLEQQGSLILTLQRELEVMKNNKNK